MAVTGALVWGCDEWAKPGRQHMNRSLGPHRFPSCARSYPPAGHPGGLVFPITHSCMDLLKVQVVFYANGKGKTRRRYRSYHFPNSTMFEQNKLTPPHSFPETPENNQLGSVRSTPSVFPDSDLLLLWGKTSFQSCRAQWGGAIFSAGAVRHGPRPMPGGLHVGQC